MAYHFLIDVQDRQTVCGEDKHRVKVVDFPESVTCPQCREVSEAFAMAEQEAEAMEEMSWEAEAERLAVGFGVVGVDI